MTTIIISAIFFHIIVLLTTVYSYNKNIQYLITKNSIIDYYQKKKNQLYQISYMGIKYLLVYLYSLTCKY